MKYFKENTSQRDDRKQIMPKYTVGSHLIGGDVPPCSDSERRKKQVENSLNMNKSKLGRIFSPFSPDEIKHPEHMKPISDDEIPA